MGGPPALDEPVMGTPKVREVKSSAGDIAKFPATEDEVIHIERTPPTLNPGRLTRARERAAVVRMGPLINVERYRAKPVEEQRFNAYAMQCIRDIKEPQNIQLPSHEVTMRTVRTDDLHVGVTTVASEITGMPFTKTMALHNGFVSRPWHLADFFSHFADNVMNAVVPSPVTPYVMSIDETNMIRFKPEKAGSHGESIRLFGPVVDLFNLIQTICTGIPFDSEHWETFPEAVIEDAQNHIDITVSLFDSVMKDIETYAFISDAVAVKFLFKATLRSVVSQELYDLVDAKKPLHTLVHLHTKFRIALYDKWIQEAIEKGKSMLKIKKLESALKAKKETTLEAAMSGMSIDDPTDPFPTANYVSVTEDTDGHIRLQAMGPDAVNVAAQIVSGLPPDTSAVTEPHPQNMAPVVDHTGCRGFFWRH